MRLTILDGPMGTELDARGADTRLPLWSARALLEAPELVAAIHADFAAAGATVHTTNTFRARRRTLGDAWEPAARRAVRLARGAVPESHRVAGSLAPLEDCYRPDLSPRDSGPAHAELAACLADAGCDVLLCETFPNPREALAAVTAAASTGVETWLAMTAGPRGDLMSPETMAETARAAVDLGARAVLVNCTAAERTLPFVRALVEAVAPDVAVGAYGNAGEPDDRVGWSTDPSVGAPRYLAHARTWVDAGATLVGGCCGTGPAHVRALATQLV